MGVLDERDLVAMIRMNGPVEGDRVGKLAPLTKEHREGIKRILNVDAPLARYGGDYTPCRSALEAAIPLLNEEDGPQAHQVVIFLSDGECKPIHPGSRSQGRLVPGNQGQVGDLMDSLYSHREDRFNFYLLRFGGRSFSQSLADLAVETGGGVIPLQGGDPTRILSRFAQAIASSQGYESQTLSAAQPQVPAHQGAERIRLLAVTPGDGNAEPLTFSVRDSQGRSVEVTDIDGGTHRFLPHGRPYRFASVQYEPTGEPVTVELPGGRADWSVVALPEYRLQVGMVLRSGACDEDGPALSGQEEVSSGVHHCAVIRLENQHGRSVGRDVTRGELSPFVRRVVNGGTPKEYFPPSKSADGTEFRIELPLDEGQNTLQGVVKIVPPDGAERTFSRTLQPFQAADHSVTPQPAAVNLGTIYPGQRATDQLRLHGRFETTPVKARLSGQDELPSCIRATFAGQPLGQPVDVSAGQPYSLQLEVAEDCPTGEATPIETALSFDLPEVDWAPDVNVPLSLVLDPTVEKTEAIVLELDAGQAAEANLEAKVHGSYSVKVEPFLGGNGEVTEDLQLGFLDAGPPKGIERREDEAPIRAKEVEAGPESPLGIRIEAGPCCSSGRYEGQMTMRASAGGTAKLTPVVVTVKGSFWTCYGPWILAGLLALLLALLAYYLLSMFTHSHFLSKKQLAARLTPLYWPPGGGYTPQPADERERRWEEVQDVVDQELVLRKRAWNWLRSKPWIFGLPGKRYYETVQLTLDRRLDQTYVSLLPERDAVGELQRAQEIDDFEEGRLFARGGSTLSFWAVVGPQKRIGRMSLQDFYDTPEHCEIVPVQKGQRMIGRNEFQEKRADQVAGWELG